MGGSSVPRMPNSVLLPEPLGPRMAAVCPAARLQRHAASTTSGSPGVGYCFATFSTTSFDMSLAISLGRISIPDAPSSVHRAMSGFFAPDCPGGLGTAASRAGPRHCLIVSGDNVDLIDSLGMPSDVRILASPFWARNWMMRVKDCCGKTGRSCSGGRCDASAGGQEGLWNPAALGRGAAGNPARRPRKKGEDAARQPLRGPSDGYPTLRGPEFAAAPRAASDHFARALLEQAKAENTCPAQTLADPGKKLDTETIYARTRPGVVAVGGIYKCHQVQTLAHPVPPADSSSATTG